MRKSSVVLILNRGEKYIAKELFHGQGKNTFELEHVIFSGVTILYSKKDFYYFHFLGLCPSYWIKLLVHTRNESFFSFPSGLFC